MEGAARKDLLEKVLWVLGGEAGSVQPHSAPSTTPSPNVQPDQWGKHLPLGPAELLQAPSHVGLVPGAESLSLPAVTEPHPCGDSTKHISRLTRMLCHSAISKCTFQSEAEG